MDIKRRLKIFFQRPVVLDVGKTASSGLVEALKHADAIASLIPLPGLGPALRSLLMIIQAVDKTAQNSDAAKRLQNRIESLTKSVLIPIKKADLKDIPEEIVIELDRLAVIFQTNVTICSVKISHGWFRRFIRREDDQGDIANMSKAIDDAVAQFLLLESIKSVEAISRVNHGVDELQEQNQIRQIISKKAENANHSYQSAQSAQRSECLEGTRATVLEQIRTFLEDTAGVNLFWLSGIAGSGKSTIAQSAAVEAKLLANCIVASFFFSQRGHAELCDASFVFPTLAYQFSLADANFRKCVSGIIKEQPDIFERDYISQYKSLIVEPLKAMDCAQRRVFIVLDAFDECEPRGATAILNALLDKDIDVPRQLKVLTTSRPEAHLRQVLYPQDNIRKLNLQDIEAKSDIRHYLLTTFKQPPITLATPFDAKEEVIIKLAESAGDSFIYAASILRFVFDEHDQDPQGRLDILLGNRTDPEERPYERLDALYLGILHQAVPPSASGPITRRLRSVLGQLVTFREPLPVVVMEKFCGLKSGDIRRALHNLHSLIQVPNADDQAPRAYHLSFSDFIIDPMRCSDRDLVVDVDSAEREVLLSCFGHLSSQLHRNMAGIDDSSLSHSEIDGFQTKVENAVSPELRYACLYWASHLVNIKDVHDEKVWALLEKFLTRCLLWWIETMALLDTLREAAESVNRVRTWMTSLKGEIDDRSSLLADLVNDALRFLSYHADTISLNALHLYHSALPFTPTETQLRKVYGHELETSVKALRGVEQGWDPTVMVMRFKAPIWDVSWSPNGRFIAAAGYKSVEIRDTLIGSSTVSIELPRPLLYDSSYSDEVRVGHRLKDLVQKCATPLATPIEGQTTRSRSRVLEALAHAEVIASFVPAWGLKNVPGSLLALIHVICDYGQYSPLEMEELELRIKSLTDVVSMLIDEKEPSDVSHQVIDDLEEFTRTIEAITATCRQTLSQGRLERFTDVAGKLIADLHSFISNAIGQFMKSETIQLLENAVKAERRVNESPVDEFQIRQRLTASLQIEQFVSEKPKSPDLSAYAQRAECLEGTRTIVLGDIFAWLEDTFSPRLFWLSGIAGSGKSAVSQSASIRAALLADHMVVSIFFSRFGYAGLYDPLSVFQTLAFQFSLLDIGYKERISEIIEEHPNIFEMDLRFQYEKLIVGPLDTIRRPHSCILIILDGLDECEPRGAAAILKVLLAEDADHPKELKILAASRPEAHLRRIFDAQCDIRKLSLEDVETENDILHYLRTSFERPPLRSPTLLVDSFTVSEETISELAKRAGNSFIYAATIVRFVFDKHCQDPQRQINFLLSRRVDPKEHPNARLDALFVGILRQALPLEASKYEKRRLRTVLGLLVCLCEPFPMDKMEKFYGLEPGDVKKALHHLHSLIQVPNLSHWAPRIYHRSFTDFVVNPARCPDRNFVVDIGSTEKRIFNKCSSLCNLLSQKIVNDLTATYSHLLMQSAGTTLHTRPFPSAEEKYACLYWASHLTKIRDVDEKTQYHLDDRCLLRWLETMALLGMPREAVTYINQVRTWMISLEGRADNASNRLVDLMDNAFRLLPRHATTISYDSLLIYNSALFTPVAEFQLPLLRVKPVLERNYLYSFRDSSHELIRRSELVSTLTPLPGLCYDFMRVLAWSPNSQCIAVSRVNSIEIRDALSGSIVDSFDLSLSLDHVLDPKMVSCRCLAFYPDNSRIAYVTGSNRVCVRNTLARTEEFVMMGHEGGLVSINVSPNGKLLVSGSKSGRIQVCNAENGALVWAVEIDTELKSTSIFPNSQFIASLSYSRNHGVRIWNANDGLPLIILPHDANSVTFCPESNQFASVDQEGLVRVWGMSQMTTEPIQEWRICAQPACPFFSPDGRKLAAATGYNVLILRHDTGDVATLNGHTGLVTSLAFSSDGLTLASGCLDGTIRVWDVIGSSRVEKDKHEKWDAEFLSPRSQVVMASKTRGRKVGIWNTQETQDGTSIVLEDFSLDFSDDSPVAISDCGGYLAALSWNPERIATRRIAPHIAQSNSFGLTLDINCFKFFPNSTRFAVASRKEIFTWDASVNHPEITHLVGHSREVHGLHFVPDRSRLLSRADEEVFAWDVDTLQLVSRTGNAIPPSPVMTMEDYWIVVRLLDSGEQRRLFRLPPGYEPHGFWRKIRRYWEVKASWSSKCILIECKNRNSLIVDLSALPAALIDFTDGSSRGLRSMYA